MKIKLMYIMLLLSVALSSCNEVPLTSEYSVTPPAYVVELPTGYEYIGATCGTTFFIDSESQKVAALRDGVVIFELPLSDEVTVLNGMLKIGGNVNAVYYDCNGQLIPDQANIFDAEESKPLNQSLNVQKNVDGLWGFLNIQGVWAIQPQFSRANPFGTSERKTYVERNNGYEPGFIDRTGNFEPACLTGGYGDNQFFDGRILSRKVFLYPERREYSTFVTDENRVLYSEAEPQLTEGYPYELARSFSEGVAAVQIGGLWGYIDLDGHIIIHPQYANAFSFNQGVAVVVKKDGSFGCIDKEGKEHGKFISIENYEPTGDYCNGQFVVQSTIDYYKNIIDEKSNLLFKSNQIFSVWDNSIMPVWSVTDGCYLPHCKTFIPGFSLKLYDDILETDGSIYDRTTGQCLGTFRRVDSFHEGLAAAEEKIYGPGKYGYINQAGEWVVPPCFTKAESFNGGLAYVELDDQTRGLIANPLIYPEDWDGDELTRAKVLGLHLPTDNSNLTGKELMACMSALTQRFGLSVEVELSETDTPFTRQEFAQVLTEISRELGNAVDYLQCSYQDIDLIEEACLSSVAYVTYLNIFEIDNGNFRPTEQITNQEAAKVVVRFFERAVSDYLSDGQ